MQTPYSFGRFCRVQPREGALEELNCLNKTRYYSTTQQPGLDKFFLSRVHNLRGDGWEFSASDSRRLCGYTHSNFLREALRGSALRTSHGGV
jgi:hypothetical protein